MLPESSSGWSELFSLTRPHPEAKRFFKRKYRYALNSMPIDDELAQKIVDEANASFTLNHDVVHKLENNVKAAICLLATVFLN